MLPVVDSRGLTRLAYGVLGYSALVLLFGAFVRASYSGDGCGAYWPLCGNGGLIPNVNSTPKAIEFTHRLTSLLLMVLTGWLYFAARKSYAPGDLVRKATGWAAVSTLVSAGIGAVLVLARWVTNDKSAGRAITMPLHLVNNYFLLAALTCATFWIAGGARPTVKTSSREDSQLKSALAWMFGGLFLLGATGAFSALGKTAFEHELSFAKTFAERMWLHVGPDANPLLKGGIVHPLIATSVGLLLLWLCGLVTQLRPSKEVKSWAKVSLVLYVVQMAIGIGNLVASAPISMQIVHLAVAVADWVALVVMAVSALGAVERQAQTDAVVETEPARLPAETGYVATETRKATLKDYIALTKPRVISLLLFTTVAAMFVAQRGMPSLWLLIAVCIGGYAAAGAANTFNMVIEEDLDKSMERTSHRPTVSHVVSKKQALVFGWSLAAGSFLLLWGSANLLSAFMALCGLLCYVFVYTLWLKRRTWQNIVIGGAAGAFPPLVGYAAVSGTLSPLAWYLFAVIFLWTPVHFWALALLIKDDYAKAGVPMLPVVKGDRVTVNQIGIYTVLTAMVSVMPFLQNQAGPTYLVGSTLLNLGLVVHSLKLWRRVEKPQARALFKYSMVYLALFFIVVACDQARWM